MNSLHEKLRLLQKNMSCEKCTAHCHSAFKTLNSDQISMIDGLRELKTFTGGQKIELNDDGIDHIFCISKGYVKIELGHERNQKSIRICGPGDLVGLHMNRLYSIQSLDVVTICKINFLSFRELQLKVPEISLGVIETLIKTQSGEDEHIKGLENHAIKNRIAATLLLLAKKFGRTEQQSALIDLAIDRKTLSQLSGTVVESLARVITELENDDVIRRQGRKIQIIDFPKLEKISNS